MTFWLIESRPQLFERWIALIYPVDNPIGFRTTYQAPVVQMLDSAIHLINHYPAAG